MINYVLVQVFSFCWQVLQFREMNNFIRLSQKHIIVLYLEIFNTQNYLLFKISASGLFYKIFLKFRKFQPRYFYKIYSYKIKRVYRYDLLLRIIVRQTDPYG